MLANGDSSDAVGAGCGPMSDHCTRGKQVGGECVHGNALGGEGTPGSRLLYGTLLLGIPE